MHDEFLHHLRREPRPEFAARLRSRLRRQSLSPPRSRAPARVRTLPTLLLLGGTAFAVTSMVMRGFPRPVVELYRHAITRINAERAAPTAHRADNPGIFEGLQWGARWTSPPRNASLRGEPTHSTAAAPISGPTVRAAAGAASGSSTAVAGAPTGSQGEGVTVLTSWASYPYAAAIAQRLNNAKRMGAKYGPPYIDVSVGTSAVWLDWPRAMCAGKANAPDMAYAFEPVATVTSHPCPQDPRIGPPVVAIPLGYEAVVLARSPLYGAIDLTRREVFLALAKWVPDAARPGTVHPNGNTLWRQIDTALGPEPIQLLGPPLSSATGRSTIELLLEEGCKTYPWVAALEATAPDKYARICRTVRTDGIYSEVSALGVSGLLAQPNAVGIFGFTDLMDDPGGSLAMSRLDGVEPTVENIESGQYPASRGIYLYVNRSRTAPGTAFSFLAAPGLMGFPQGVFLPLPEPQRRAAFAAAYY